MPSSTLCGAATRSATSTCRRRRSASGPRSSRCAPPHADRAMDLFKGISFKLISALLFAAMSALVRQLGDVAPVGQMVFFRSAFAILPVVVIYALRGELMTAVRTRRPLGQLGRGLLSVCGMFTNFSALTRLPLADVTAIGFASPLITVALAALILREHVRIFRWSAVAVRLGRGIG